MPFISVFLFSLSPYSLNWSSLRSTISISFISTMNQVFRRSSNCRINSPKYTFLQLIQHFQVAITITSPVMTSILYAMLYISFMEIKRNLRRKRLDTTSQGSNLKVGGKGSFFLNSCHKFSLLLRYFYM